MKTKGPILARQAGYSFSSSESKKKSAGNKQCKLMMREVLEIDKNLVSGHYTSLNTRQGMLVMVPCMHVRRNRRWTCEEN